MRKTLFLAVIVCFIALSLFAAPIVIHVDATQASTNILHARLTIPVTPGPLTLYYPKWIPGEHSPSGPINNLTGLKFEANGATIPWNRDPVEMYAFHVDIPAGATTLEVSLDYLEPPAGGFTAGATATPRLAVLSWNTVLLYPKTTDTHLLEYEPFLRIPAGWKYATALEARSTGEEIGFETVNLNRLIDSPVQMGELTRAIQIPNNTGLRHTINLAADSAAALDVPADFASQYSRLVVEATALFGANHYRHYDWLLTLSDQVAHFGLEHHESSDDRIGERALVDEHSRPWVSTLLAHEYVHSWNGKYRRPAGLAVPSYDQPMTDELLWVYEGLTNFLGELLPWRARILTEEQYRDQVALDAAEMAEHVGRTWRPLQDTAVAAPTLYSGGGMVGASWRRGTDFYPEGTLIWMDVDMTIRRITGGKRSLNDFCHEFYDGGSGRPELKPYTFDDLVNALNAVAPYDWRSFFNQRLTSTSATPPLGGIEGAGWKLVYTDKPNLAMERYVRGALNLNDSLGFSVRSGGQIGDVIPGSPAAQAGLIGGSQIVAVDGRRFSIDDLRDAVKASTSSTQPIELIVESGQFFSTKRITYAGGLRYPHLERMAGKPDLLEMLGKPLASK